MISSGSIENKLNRQHLWPALFTTDNHFNSSLNLYK